MYGYPNEHSEYKKFNLEWFVCATIFVICCGYVTSRHVKIKYWNILKDNELFLVREEIIEILHVGICKKSDG